MFAAIDLNQVAQFIPAIIVFGLVALTFLVVRGAIYSELSRKQNRFMLFLASQLKNLSWFAGLITALYLALLVTPNTTATVKNATYILFVIVWMWQLVMLISDIINYLLEQLTTKTDRSSNVTTYKFLGVVVKALVWIVAILLVLSNLGYDVSSLVAGLGIGGIALALAVQNILSDFISSLSLVIDKPFEVGDFISFDKYKGTVEKVGIKSTYIRSLDGEEIIVPNAMLVRSPIQNFGRIKHQRAQYHLIVSKETQTTLAKDVPVFVEEILQAQPKVAKESWEIHLVNLADNGYDYELSFNVNTPDYAEFLSIKQEVLFAIKEKLDSEQISFSAT